MLEKTLKIGTCQFVVGKFTFFRKGVFTLKISLLVIVGIMLNSCSRILSNEDLDALRGGPGQKYTALFMNGEKCGFTRYSRTVLDDRIITRVVQDYTYKMLSSKRQFSHIKISIGSPEGTVLGFENDDIKGILNAAGKFDIIDLKSGKKLREMDLPAGALLKEGYRKLRREKGLEEGTTYEATKFDVEYLKSEQISVRVGKKKEIQLVDTSEELTELFVIYNTPNGKREELEYLDDDCDVRMTMFSIGAIKFKKVICSREFALSNNGGDIAGLVGFVKPPKRLKGYRKAKAISYRLKPKGVETLELHESDCQILKRLDNGEVVLTVKALKAADGISFPYQGNDTKALEALRPTELVQSDDELIVKLAKKAVGKTNDSAKAVKKIERFVFGYIRNKKEDYSIDTLTAVDVARDRRGDCSGHALLMTAICRAVGIPARVMSGYRYTYMFGRGNGFAAHAWTEVYIDGKWIGCDATRFGLFGPSKSYDASYIATYSSLGKAKDTYIDVGRLGSFEIIDVQVYR